MTSVIEYYSDSIITKSRGFLEYATLGNWGQVCTLDLTRRTLEVRTRRLLDSNTRVHSLNEFDAVDYSYECLQSVTRESVEYDSDEFRVGLRFRSTGKVLPLAVFHGSTSTPVVNGLFDAFITSILPASWMEGTGGTQDVESRALANMLCHKLSLELAL
ncbi:hypothetical protein [Roseimicrobium sp. ORNL1]|uniref:hypothetical protein n=1 Tax=Roseimicrobium sp. ORNL1 TaxID=2711231 RepID=UPI0013E1E7BD|nr:hypothetical protein [Roseimicrobium sp. ORNL1]QIF04981.1 hypothetical protein G5S37_26870 [Roseimicrobium sp. ORNL1]